MPAEGDEVLYSEPGRIIYGGRRLYSGDSGGVDCGSHSFKLVRARGGGLYLLVRHGGGDERVRIDWSERPVRSFEPLDSDARYWLLHTLLKLHTEATRAAEQETANKYASAFAEGRLKKRRRNHRIYVEIAPRAVAAEAEG